MKKLFAMLSLCLALAVALCGAALAYTDIDVATQEEMDAIYSFKLGDDTYTMGQPLSAVTANGWVPVKSGLDPLPEALSSMTYSQIAIERDDISMGLSVYNVTDGDQKLEDCQIGEIAGAFYSDNNPVLANGLGVGSTVQEVIDAYGLTDVSGETISIRFNLQGDAVDGVVKYATQVRGENSIDFTFDKDSSEPDAVVTFFNVRYFK